MNPILYVDMDDTLCKYTSTLLPQITSKLQFPQGQLGFYRNLEPIKDAIESVTKLINSNLYDVYILTAPSVINTHSYSEKREWIEKYFGYEFCHKLIISPNKGLLKGSYLIDDCSFGKGQEGFRGELILFGGDKYPTWESVIEYLLPQKTKYTFLQMKEEIQ